MNHWIIDGYDSEKIVKNSGFISQIYEEFGVVIFPKFFKNDLLFQRYKKELSLIFDRLLNRHTNMVSPDDLGEKLTVLSKVCPLDGKIITDLGTQPNKFNSFNRIKYSEYVDVILNAIFKESALMLTPQAGDTLHFFPPGDVFHQYNLPPHQDYQYLMQSPCQITFYMGLSDYKKNVGGLRVWEKSHHLGILKSHKNKFGAYEITDYEEILKKYSFFDYEWNDGDLGIFNSLLAHSSIPNTTLDASRVVQIFRFSDINNKISESFDYRSTCYNRRGVFFSDIHSDLYV